MLDKRRDRPPQVNHQKDPGLVTLYMPFLLSILPSTRVTIDLGVGVRLPRGLGAVVRIKPQLVHLSKLRVVEQILGKFLHFAAQRKTKL